MADDDTPDVIVDDSTEIIEAPEVIDNSVEDESVTVVVDAGEDRSTPTFGEAVEIGQRLATAEMAAQAALEAAQEAVTVADSVAEELPTVVAEVSDVIAGQTLGTDDLLMGDEIPGEEALPVDVPPVTRKGRFNAWWNGTNR